VGKVWRLMLADLGLNAMAVLRRAGLPSGLLDGDGSRITLDEFYALWESFDAEAQSPTLALNSVRSKRANSSILPSLRPCARPT
jgi:hypothetical protein